MPLHPMLQALLEQGRQEPPPHTLSLQAQRERMQRIGRSLPRSPVALAGVEDFAIDLADRRISLRLYRPAGVERPGVVLFFHGGGWCTCDLDTHDGQCRRLCAESGAAVLAVDYRRAPEHPYPVPFQDCLDATQWTRRHGAALGIDPQRIVLCGDSAGGNLAAGVAHALRDGGVWQPRGLALVYPALQHPSRPSPSYQRYAEGYGLTLEGGLRSWAAYLPHPERGIPAHAAPLHDTQFAGLPPTLILSAEYDILHDEAEVYAGRLREAGVEVELEPVAGVNHGFLALEAVLPPADAAMRRLGAWIARRLA